MIGIHYVFQERAQVWNLTAIVNGAAVFVLVFRGCFGTAEDFKAHWTGATSVQSRLWGSSLMIILAAV